MQNVSRRKRNFEIEFFLNKEFEFKDFFKAKEMIKNGEDIIAVGYVNLNGREMLVRTSKINKIKTNQSTITLFTNNMEYSVRVS